jgi:hypothetical protein
MKEDDADRSHIRLTDKVSIYYNHRLHFNSRYKDKLLQLDRMGDIHASDGGESKATPVAIGVVIEIFFIKATIH